MIVVRRSEMEQAGLDRWVPLAYRLSMSLGVGPMKSKSEAERKTVDDTFLRFMKVCMVSNCMRLLPFHALMLVKTRLDVQMVLLSFIHLFISLQIRGLTESAHVSRGTGISPTIPPTKWGVLLQGDQSHSSKASPIRYTNIEQLYCTSRALGPGVVWPRRADDQLDCCVLVTPL